MQLPRLLFFVLSGLLVAAASERPQPSTTPNLEKYTIAHGTVVNTANNNTLLLLHGSVNKATRSEGEVFERSPSDMTAPSPGTVKPSIKQPVHPRDLKRLQKVCPMNAPWLCEGKTCMDIFTQSCCKGGVVCSGDKVCSHNMNGDIVCGPL